MRRLVLGSVAIIACIAGNSARAADLPVKAPAVAPAGGTRVPATADLSPSGSYLNAPGGNPPPNLQGTGDIAADIAALPHSYGLTPSGWEAGAQVGCNAQWGAAVLGIEGDWQWTHAAASTDAAYAAFPNAGNPPLSPIPRTPSTST